MTPQDESIDWAREAQALRDELDSAKRQAAAEIRGLEDALREAERHARQGPARKFTGASPHQHKHKHG